MTPLLDGHRPDGPILHLGAGAPVAASTFVGAAMSLAARMPQGRYALQRCERTEAFLLSTCAAWCAGRTVVMPPTRLAADRDALVERFPDTVELSDDAVDAAACLRDAPGRWPPPELPDNLVAAILFTSGSTREPRAAAKTWGSLCRGAAAFRSTFAIAPGAATLAGTVSPQHMFGLEATILAALRGGCALWAARPRYGADLAAIARDIEGARLPPLFLATTPLHLEHFRRSLDIAPHVPRIVVSTMPMPRPLAEDVERAWGTRIDEIYGSTECGMIAARRPAHDDAFTVAAGLAIAIGADGAATASGGQLDAPARLDDRLAWIDEPRGRFALEGRAGDTVKIAGKRTTLAALGDHLKRIDGVEDGVFFPSAAHPGRLAALVVAPALTDAQIRRALAERIDAAFLPRPLVRVPSLPRDGRGKLPLDALQRLAEASPAARDDRIARSLVIDPGHPSLPGHFPGEPVVPGVVLLAEVESALRDQGLRVVACRRVKFVAPVPPGERLRLDVELADLDAVPFTMTLPGGVAVSGTLRCVEA